MNYEAMKKPVEKIIKLLEKHKPCIHEDCEKCRHREDCAAYACIAAAQILKASIEKETQL